MGCGRFTSKRHLPKPPEACESSRTYKSCRIRATGGQPSDQGEVTVMYGMVNQALEELVLERGGPTLWERVKSEAGVSVDMFVRSHGYPDEMTYSLVGAASRCLDLEPSKFLEEFGVHWVLKTAEEGYPDLMKAGGKTLPEFLQRLPDFHTRISLMFPELKPPEFRCSDISEDSLHLHYFSGRAGLAPFVVGLI